MSQMKNPHSDQHSEGGRHRVQDASRQGSPQFIVKGASGLGAQRFRHRFSDDSEGQGTCSALVYALMQYLDSSLLRALNPSVASLVHAGSIQGASALAVSYFGHREKDHAIHVVRCLRGLGVGWFW